MSGCIPSVRVHRGEAGKKDAEGPCGGERERVDEAAVQILPHVDTASERGARFRRFEQEAAHGVVHAHVVDPVPHDERQRAPEDQQPLLDTTHDVRLKTETTEPDLVASAVRRKRRRAHAPYLSTSAVISSLCGAPLVKARTSENSACSRSLGWASRFCSATARMRSSPYSSLVTDIASDTPSLNTISQSPGSRTTVSS